MNDTEDNALLQDDETWRDPDLIRHLLHQAIKGLQETIEKTNEDETRIRSKTVLQALWRLKGHLEAQMERGVRG